MLAEWLRRYAGTAGVLFAIPSGGVPVAKEIAQRLQLPVRVIFVRKLQIPFEPEAGFGALAEDGTVVYNEPLLRSLALSDERIQACVEQAREELVRRRRLLSEPPAEPLAGRTAVVIDDGLASGYTMLVAVRSLRRQAGGLVVVAVPTGSAIALSLIRREADQVVCLNVREHSVFAVADAYQRWHDVSDYELRDALEGQ